MGARFGWIGVRRGRVRAVLVALVAAVVALGVLTSQVGSSAVAADGRSGSRLAGDDRYATSAAIAEHAWPDGAATAYLARSDVGADALSATNLNDGPVLLVPPCGPIPTPIVESLDRLGTEEVVALGGPMAVAPQVLDQAVDGVRDEELVCPGAIPDSRDGLRLTATPEGDAVSLTLFNDRPGQVHAGYGFGLEERNGAGFDFYEPWREVVFIQVLAIMEPHSSLDLGTVGPEVHAGEQPEPLPSGTYRVRYSVEDVELAVTFNYVHPGD